MSEMSGEYTGHGRNGTFSASRNCGQILAKLGLCIILLKHEVMEVDEWHDNRPQDLITVYLCIQFAIDKIQLDSLSVSFACSHHNPSSQSSHQYSFAHTLSAICTV